MQQERAIINIKRDGVTMGGQEGSRGYLYQGIAAVLEALTSDNWDKIYIEFPTGNDKVDIALSKNDRIVRAIQVKSTQKTFGLTSLKQWITDLYNDYKADEYEVILIGQCTTDTLKFINAIPKYRNRHSIELDKTASRVLCDFDVSILDTSSVAIKHLPYNLESLSAILNNSLHKYLSSRPPAPSYGEIDLLGKALISEQLLHSTNGSFTNRISFEHDIHTRIKSIAESTRTQRIPVCIKSFARYSDHPDVSEKNILDLTNVFDGRRIRAGLSWQSDIVAPVVAFLTTTTDQKEKYKLYLETHASVAFVTGRQFDTKSGVDIVPVQKTGTNGSEVWELSGTIHEDFSDWSVANEIIDDDSFNTVLILSITHDIRSDVERFIMESGIKVGRLISCSLHAGGGTNWGIKSGDHASFLANRIYSILACRTTPERRGHLHIFPAAPNGFMFYLGTVSRGFGKGTLYEYDFEQTDTCTYTPSITFNPLGG